MDVWTPAGAAVLLGLGMGIVIGCRAPASLTDANTLSLANGVLAERTVPIATPGAVTRAGTWRVFASGGGSDTLYLLQQVAAIRLPDGPIELTDTVAYVRHDGRGWMQPTPAPAPALGGRNATLPPPLLAALHADFTDVETSYFYRVGTIDLRSMANDTLQLQRTVRAMLRTLEQDAVRLRKAGFISADAAP